MGWDIHVVAQRKVGGQWEDIAGEFLSDRIYGRFGFLAGVCNYSAVKPIAERRGLPIDIDVRSFDQVDGCSFGDHSFSWLSLRELLDFNYEQLTEDRRFAGIDSFGRKSGALTCEAGKGKTQTYRNFLGPEYFNELEKLQAAGADRIVFGFDS